MADGPKIGPGDGGFVDLGGLGIRFMVEGEETEGSSRWSSIPSSRVHWARRCAGTPTRTSTATSSRVVWALSWARRSSSRSRETWCSSRVGSGTPSGTPATSRLGCSSRSHRRASRTTSGRWGSLSPTGRQIPRGVRRSRRSTSSRSIPTGHGPGRGHGLRFGGAECIGLIRIMARNGRQTLPRPRIEIQSTSANRGSGRDRRRPGALPPGDRSGTPSHRGEPLAGGRAPRGSGSPLRPRRGLGSCSRCLRRACPRAASAIEHLPQTNRAHRGGLVAVVKIIELVGSSKKSSDDAAQQALKQAQSSLRTSARLTSSPPGCAARTWTNGGPTSGSHFWSRAPTSLI